jgi:hypothetical protein
MFGIIWCIIDILVSIVLFWISQKCAEGWGFALRIAGYACLILALYSLVYGIRKGFKIAKMAHWAIQNPEQLEEVKKLLNRKL